MQNKGKFLKLLAIEALLGVLLLGGIFFNEIRDFFYNQNIKQIDTNCSLNKSECKATLLNSESVTALISPKELYPLQKIDFNITANNIQSAKLTIIGTNMDMGIHSFDMQKLTNEIYNTSFMLPSCTIDMKWQVKANISTDGQNYQITYNLESHK